MSRVESPPSGAIPDILAGKVDSEFAEPQFLNSLLRESVPEIHILEVQVAGIRKEAVRTCVLVLVLVLEARDVGVRILGRPGLENILVPVHACVLVRRRVHCIRIAGVVCQSANLPCEVDGEIEAEE